MIEPSGDIRVAAAQIRQLFVALLQQGFSEEQVMYLLGELMKAPRAPHD